MKIAVIFSGQLRTGSHVAENIKQFFTHDEYQVDYYGHTWSYNMNKLPGGRHMDEEIINPKEFEYISSIYNFKSLTIEDKNQYEVGHACNHWSPLFYSMWKSFQLCKDTNKRYDLLVKMRYDLSFRNDDNFINYIPLKYFPNKIYKWIMPSIYDYPELEYQRANVSEIMFWGDEEGMYMATDVYLHEMTKIRSDGLRKIYTEGPGIILGNFINKRQIRIIDINSNIFLPRPEQIIRNTMVGKLDISDHEAVREAEYQFHERRNE